MDEFYTLSQVSMTIAGFAALFSILKPNNAKEWTPNDKQNLTRFYMMIEIATIITCFSFLPAIFLGFLDEEMSFRLSFASYFFVVCIYIILTSRRTKRINNKIIFFGRSTVVFLAVTAILQIYAVLGALNLIGTNHKTNYLILLYIAFLQSIYLFLRLIYFSIRTH